MKKITYLFTFLVFFSCTNAENTSSSTDKSGKETAATETKMPKSDTLVYKIKTIKNHIGDCENEGCVIAETSYVSLRERNETHGFINKNIVARLAGESESIEAAHQQYLDEYTEFIEEEEIEGVNWSQGLTQSVVLNDPDFFSIREDFYSFSGGAHGNSGTVFQNFEAETSRIFMLDDLLQDEYATKVKELIIADLKKQFAEYGNTFEEIGFSVSEEELEISDNFGITKKGLLFIYQPYQIASYAMGQQEILIPYKSIKTFIRDKRLLRYNTTIN